jgi:hypothetical protein
MAFTQPQLDALETAIATGVLTVAHEGKHTTFRSLNEMMRVRETMRAALGLTSPTTRYSLTSFTKDSSTPPPRTDYRDPWGQNVIG